MGFIGKIFSGIFGFLGSILKVFGIGKSSYYVELDDAASSAPSQPTPAPATPAPVEKVSPVPATATVTPEPAKPAPATTKKVKPSKATKTEPAKPAAAAKSAPEPTVEPFAPNFLMPQRSPRRRPGANMSEFMDMARQVKTS